MGLLMVVALPIRTISAQQVACMGQVVPGDRVVRVAAPANAIIAELRVTRGSQVAKDDVIAVLRDALIYQAQLDRAKQQVALAEADLTLLCAGERHELVEAQESLIAANEAEAHLLESRVQRYGTLIEEKHVAQDQYDDVLSQLDSLRATIHRERSVLESLRACRPEVITKAEIAVRLAEAQAAEAEANLALQYIRAPFAGEVLDVHAWPGESIWDGGAIASLGDTTNMMIVAEVYESDLPRVKLGQRALIRGQAFKGDLGGEVVEIQKVLESSRVFPLDPSAYVDSRIVAVRIRPDDSHSLASLNNAQVTVTILAP